MTAVETRPRRPHVVEYLMLAGIVVLATVFIALRVVRLTSQSMWIDEGITVELSTASSLAGVLSNVAGATGSDQYQPLYSFILYAWRLLFGSGEASLRSLSVVLGSAAVFVAAPSGPLSLGAFRPAPCTTVRKSGPTASSC